MARCEGHLALLTPLLLTPPLCTGKSARVLACLAQLVQLCSESDQLVGVVLYQVVPVELPPRAVLAPPLLARRLLGDLGSALSYCTHARLA